MHRGQFAVLVWTVSGLIAQQPPLTPIVPLSIDPHTVAAGTTSGLPAVITTDGSGATISVIAQLELRPMGSSGQYRVTGAALLMGNPRPQLFDGTLDLSVTPPAWSPGSSVQQLNVANKVHFQLSMSPDGLVAVWDVYNGVTSADYPALPPGSHYAFVCARPSTVVPFRAGAVRAMFTNRPPSSFPWTDSHLGDAPQLPSGKYELFYSDATLGGQGDLWRGEVDPSTGTVTPVVIVRTKPSTGITYYHSPQDLRDSAGRVRALAFGQSPAATANSDILCARNGADTGTPYVVMDGAVALPPPLSSAAPIWFSNGTIVGGSITFGVYTTTQVDPHRAEYVLLTDANVRSGEPLVAFAPIRPAAPAPAFLSWVAISTALLPAPVPTPWGLLLVDPTYLVAITGPMVHDNLTGRAELSFGAYTPTWPTTTWPMQTVTLDLTTAALWFGNAADFTF